MKQILDDFNNKLFLRNKNAEIFFDYVNNNYDMSNAGTSGKLYHTFRVAENCISIGKKLGLDEELCYNIGLLHDYSRFYQWEKYHTYFDHLSFDHADYSVNLLFNEGEIDRFELDEKYYEIVKFAVKNHNKAKINLTELNSLNKSMLDEIENYCKLIRDADKIDIIYRFIKRDIKIIVDGDGLSQNVLDSVEQHTYVNKKDVKTRLDAILMHLAYMYDFNYKESANCIDFTKLWDSIINHYGAELCENDKVTLIKCIDIFKDYFSKNK